MRLLSLLLALAVGLNAAPSYNSDAVSFTDAAPGTGTITHAFTQGAGSGNLMLVVAIAYETNSATSWNAAFNGATMTAVRKDSQSNTFTDIYVLQSPATGTFNITYSPTGGYFAGPVGMMAFSYSGVNGTGATNGTIGSPTGSPFPINITLTPSTSSGTVVGVGHIAAGGCNGATWTLSANPGTSRYVFYSAQNNPKGFGFMDYSPGSTSNYNQTITFTASCSSSSTMTGSLVELLDSGATPTPTPVPSTAVPLRMMTGCGL
jgi:hypothetical protein